MQPIRQVYGFSLAITIAAFSRTLLADGNFGDLLAKAPASANTIVVLNPEKIFASDVAAEGGWKQKYESTYADAPLLLPPSARQFILSADLDLATFTPRWQAAVMRLNSDPPIGMIARTVRGRQETLAGMEVVTTPKGAMIVKFGPALFGLRHPGDRQAVARWIQESNARSESALSPYLKEAADVPDRVGTEIIMAIDLANALSSERVAEAMSKSKVLQDKSLDSKAVANVLSSVRGVTLGARVIKRVYGVLKIDFESDATVLGEIAKPLLLEVLGEAGMSIDEFAAWNPKVEGRRITLSGELSSSGLRRLFSFLEIDATAVDAPADAKAGAAPSEKSDADAYKSLQYFQSVVRYLNDLKGERGASSYYTIAVWFDKYARKIDRLPILRVDKDLVDYGQRTVAQLRNCVEAIRGSGIRSGARSAQVMGSSSDYPLFGSAATYAQIEVGGVEQERRAIRAEEKAQSSTDVRGIIRQIQEDTSIIRRRMTERYNIEFAEVPRAPASR